MPVLPDYSKMSRPSLGGATGPSAPRPMPTPSVGLTGPGRQAPMPTRGGAPAPGMTGPTSMPGPSAGGRSAKDQLKAIKEKMLKRGKVKKGSKLPDLKQFTEPSFGKPKLPNRMVPL